MNFKLVRVFDESIFVKEIKYYIIFPNALTLHIENLIHSIYISIRKMYLYIGNILLFKLIALINPLSIFLQKYIHFHFIKTNKKIVHSK